MASVDYPEPFKVLVAQLKKLPGIGPKSAERLAFHPRKATPQAALALADANGEATGYLK